MSATLAPLLVLAAAIRIQVGDAAPVRADFDEVRTGDISRAIDDMFADYDGETPGCAVLVVRDGEVVHAAGYGLADLERGIPFRPDTSTRLGSVTKQFTAMAVMILKERGALSFDDPVAEHIPEIEARYGREMTVRHLLTHTSGIPDYYGVEDVLPEGRRPVTEDVARIYARWGKPEFAPGEKFRYSNPGYELLGVVIERASGQSFADFLQDAIFEPLGMKGAVAFDSEDTAIRNRAYGYRPAGGGFELNDDDVLNWMMGAGGVYLSLRDLYLWDQALYSDALVSRETLDEAFTSATLNDGTKTGYGFGWRVDEYRGVRRQSHGGAWVGFRTAIARFPDRRLTIAALGNRADFDPSPRIRQIADLILDEDSG